MRGRRAGAIQCNKGLGVRHHAGDIRNVSGMQNRVFGAHVLCAFESPPAIAGQVFFEMRPAPRKYVAALSSDCSHARFVAVTSF